MYMRTSASHTFIDNQIQLPALICPRSLLPFTHTQLAISITTTTSPPTNSKLNPLSQLHNFSMCVCGECAGRKRKRERELCSGCDLIALAFVFGELPHCVWVCVCVCRAKPNGNMRNCATATQRAPCITTALRQRQNERRAAAATKATLHKTTTTSLYLIYYMETLRLCGGFACCFLFFFFRFFFVFVFCFAFCLFF